MTAKHPHSRSELVNSTAGAGRIQLLVANEGNRQVITSMLSDQFDVETNATIQEADLYLVEDRLLPDYREALRRQVAQSDPVFCPVVIIRRDRGTVRTDWLAANDAETLSLVDEFVDAPITKQLLVSRVRSLLVRRQQSLELLSQVETLERQERDLRRFERALTDSGTPTAITAVDGTIEHVNPKFTDLTGYPEDVAVGQSLDQFLPEAFRGTFDDAFWQTMAEESEWNQEILIEQQNNEYRITETTITPITTEDGKIEGFVIVMPDITQRIEHEQLLRNREQELDVLRQILSRYLRHNLRNQLNVILSYAELLETKVSESDKPPVRKIIETTERLVETSGTARKYSTLIEQESELAPYDISQTVEEIGEEIRRGYPGVSLDIETPAECHVLAREGIREAIRGLVDNAARHNTAEAPWVGVTVRDADGVKIVIEDNGPGLSELEHETLEQGGETPLRHSQGIGLWFSKWVIEGLDGQLLFDSTADGGTRVTIDFTPSDQTEAKRVAVSDLKAREQRLEKIIQRMTDAVLEVNASGEITFVDERAEAILDIDGDVVQGRNLFHVFPISRGTQFETVYHETLQSRSDRRVEEYYAGVDTWLDIQIYPNFDGGLSFYFRDVTDRKTREWKLADARARMELALEQTSAAVWEWDPDTDAVTVHPAEHPVFHTQIRTGDEFLEAIHPGDRSRVQAALESTAENGPVFDIEYRVQDGETVRWAADYGELHDDRDETRRVVGVSRDITERKQQEAELRELEQFNRELVENAPVGLFRLDENMRIIYENERAEEIMGVPSDADQSIAIGTDPRELDSVKDTELVSILDRLETGEPVSFESPFESLYGNKRYVTGQGVPLFDTERFDGAILMIQDITEQHAQKQQLEAERRRFSSLVKVLPHAVYRADPDILETTYVNDAVEDTHGYSADEWIANPTLWERSLHPADADTVKEVFQEHRESREPGQLQYRILTSDGETRWIEDTFRWEYDDEGEVTALVGLFTDITDRKDREQKLRERVKELTGIQQATQTLIRNDGSVDELFAEFIKLVPSSFQYPDQMAAKITYKNHEVSTADFESSEQCLCSRMETETDGTVEITVVSLQEGAPDDEEAFLPEEQRLLDTFVALIGNHLERLEYLHRLERQNAALETKTRQLDAILEHTTRPMFMKTVDGEYLLVNREYKDQFGLTEADIIGRTDFDLHPPAMAEEVRENDQIVIETGEPIEVEERILIDGEERLYLSSKVPIYFDETDTGPDAVFGMATDITNRTAQQQELERQNQRLEAFASIVSHDLRNPLNVAQLRLQLLKEEYQSEQIPPIEDAHQRMQTLIEDMLVLTRYGDKVGDTESVSLATLAESCWETVTGGDETAGTLVVETTQTITADESRLRQLLENLFRNAVEHGSTSSQTQSDDAVEHGSTSNRPEADDSVEHGPEGVTVTIGDLDDGFYVEDDGPGITAEDRDTVFDSGYSMVAGGTGLGLSIVKQIAAGHGWDCQLADDDSSGARFEITGVDSDTV